MRFWVRKLIRHKYIIVEPTITNHIQNPDEDNKLCRTDRVVDTLPGLSRFQQATIHQGG